MDYLTAVHMRIKLICLSIFFLAGCAVIAPERGEITPLVPVHPSELRTLEDDLDQPSLELAIYRSIQYYNRLPETREFLFGERVCTAGELKESLREFLKIIRMPVSNSDRTEIIKQTFDIYKSIGKHNGEILFTGYYEPILAGSFDRTPEYRYPIYRTPDDHVVIDLGQFREKYSGERIIARIEDGRAVPYYTRGDIDINGSLEGRGLEILWLSDPVDLFFLQIQGSGVVSLPGGDLVQVSYAQCNGHPYQSVGRLLVEQGKMSIEEVSLKGIKRYLREHPEEMLDILSCNESYVFFRIVEEGPVGSLNVPVTPGRSIATDAGIFPKGALAFIRVKKPVIDEGGNIVSWEPFSRFVLNQDAGGAIKGPARVDLFCGRGNNAEIMAGHLKEEGVLYFLIKKKE
ncbi:MAG: MltA domain-containing protein [Deltaproteobacteria bacterium]|nr:MltA domain-containing protein [Deltaproteobacteria bacterium]